MVLWVAPLAGSVDRNGANFYAFRNRYWSLPSRGAWIEIMLSATATARWAGRSPRGERG